MISSTLYTVCGVSAWADYDKLARIHNMDLQVILLAIVTLARQPNEALPERFVTMVPAVYRLARPEHSRYWIWEGQQGLCDVGLDTVAVRVRLCLSVVLARPRCDVESLGKYTNQVIYQAKGVL